MWCNAWDFKIKSLTIPKFQEKLNNFEKTLKFFKKPQILGFKTWNAWIWEIRSLPSEENLEKAWRNLEEENWSEREIWELKRQMYRERDREKWAVDRTRRLNRPSVNLDKCRCWEVLSKFLRKVSRKWSSTNEGVEQVSRNNPPYQAPKLDWLT